MAQTVILLVSSAEYCTTRFVISILKPWGCFINRLPVYIKVSSKSCSTKDVPCAIAGSIVVGYTVTHDLRSSV